jgi:hypothetical protein
MAETASRTATAPLQRCSQWLTRALCPRVMEFKVISREREKHEFMPVVYLLDRSPNWRKRVPRAVEQQLIEDYIAPLLPVRQHASADEIGFSADELRLVGDAFQRRTELLKQAATHEVAYKMALLVNYAPKPTLHRSELFQIVQQLLTTLAGATHRRALIVPVSLHYCSDGGVLNTKRHAGIRYGSPVLVEKRDVEIFQEDPLEYVHHVSAKLQAALVKMPPPQTAAQMEVIRLSRSLHVFCARVVRDDCFSRRQIASMNEEILQIHFRTRNHPDMHVLKTTMQQYCHKLRKWRLQDEDINAASVAKASSLPQTPTQIASVIVSILLRFGAAPSRLLLSGLGDVVFRARQRRTVAEITGLAVAVLKCVAAVVLGVALLRLVVCCGSHWVSVVFVLVLLGLHSISSCSSSSSDDHAIAAHWKKIQFYLMDATELRELKELRAVLARRIHALVAQYVSADLPPPVLQSPSKTPSRPPSRRESQEMTTDEEGDDDATHGLRFQYSLNPHHKIFINAPRSFPLDFADDVQDDLTARRAVYAPKMLRDEVWRNIYGTLAPHQLQFAVLLADNTGDSLPMERLLATPFFNAVLTAYVLHQKSRARSASDVSGSDDASWIDAMAAESDASETVKEPAADEGGPLGSFSSVRDIVEAALDLAEEEEQLSS